MKAESTNKRVRRVQSKSLNMGTSTIADAVAAASVTTAPAAGNVVPFATVEGRLAVGVDGTEREVKTGQYRVNGYQHETYTLLDRKRAVSILTMSGSVTRSILQASLSLIQDTMLYMSEVDWTIKAKSEKPSVFAEPWVKVEAQFMPHQIDGNGNIKLLAPLPQSWKQAKSAVKQALAAGVISRENGFIGLPNDKGIMGLTMIQELTSKAKPKQLTSTREEQRAERLENLIKTFDGNSEGKGITAPEDIGACLDGSTAKQLVKIATATLGESNVRDMVRGISAKPTSPASLASLLADYPDGLVNTAIQIWQQKYAAKALNDAMEQSAVQADTTPAVAIAA